MTDRVTLFDIAQAAGVSTATVSRVITGRGPVSEEMRRRVEAAAEALQVNVADRGRAGGRQTGTIALVLNHLDWPIIPEWLSAAHRAMAGFGYNAIVTASEGGSAVRQHCTRLIVEGQVDGAIFYSPHGETYTAILDQLGIPDPQHHGRGSFCIDLRRKRGFYVLVDEGQVGRLAATHLVSAGARSIAMIAGPQDATVSTARQKAFLDAVAALGQPRDGILTEAANSWTFDGGYAAMGAVLARNDRVDGLFVASDNAAIGALRLLHERGVKVPGDLILVSVDNMLDGAYSIPSLTTIDIRVRDRAEIAVSELVHLMEEDRAEPKDVAVPVNIVVRESSRFLTRRS